MTDIAARLREVIEERLRVAKATKAALRRPHLTVNLQYRTGDGPAADRVRQFHALNDPADAILAGERDLGVLERHVPVQVADSIGNLGRIRLTSLTPQCLHGRAAGLLVEWHPWPCDEITAMAKRYGVTE